MQRSGFLFCWFLFSTTTGLTEQVARDDILRVKRNKPTSHTRYTLKETARSIEEAEKRRSSTEHRKETIRRIKERYNAKIGLSVEQTSGSAKKVKAKTKEEHLAHLEEVKRRILEKAGALRENKDSSREWMSDRFKDLSDRRTDWRAELHRRRVDSNFQTFDIVDSNDGILRLDSETFPNGRVFLIVNSASECEYTPQYAGLEELYQEYKDRGLRVIAFPSNSFHKEPGRNQYIQSFVKEHYKVTFPVMGKVQVNGPNAPELWMHLKTRAIRRPKIPSWSPLENSGLWFKDIQWNFEKFLVWTVDDIEIIKRFPYDEPPKNLAKYVQRAFRRLDMTPQRKKMEL